MQTATKLVDLKDVVVQFTLGRFEHPWRNPGSRRQKRLEKSRHDRVWYTDGGARTHYYNKRTKIGYSVVFSLPRTKKEDK